MTDLKEDTNDLEIHDGLAWLAVDYGSSITPDDVEDPDGDITYYCIGNRNGIDILIRQLQEIREKLPEIKT